MTDVFAALYAPHIYTHSITDSNTSHATFSPAVVADRSVSNFVTCEVFQTLIQPLSPMLSLEPHTVLTWDFL